MLNYYIILGGILKMAIYDSEFIISSLLSEEGTKEFHILSFYVVLTNHAKLHTIFHTA